MKQNLKDIFFNVILTIGIVVGVGIFFKNNSIIAAAHGKTTIIIIAWVVGGLISVSSAIAISLLNMKTKNSDNNVADFVHLAYGKKFSKYTKWSFLFLYYPIYLFVIAIFTSIQLFNLFGFTTTSSTDYSYTAILLITAITISLLFVAFTFIAPKISKYTQVSTTFIKLIPFFLLTIVVIGSLFVNNTNSFWNTNNNGLINWGTNTYKDTYAQTTGMSQIAIIFWVIPAIKFTFDGFVSVTSNKRSTSPKATSLGIGIGMLIVTGLYIITTIALLSQGVTNVPDALISFFGGNIHSLTTKFIVIKKIILAVIVISGLGSLNGFSIIWSKMAKQVVEDETSYHKKTVVWSLIISFMFATIPWLILSFILGNRFEVFDVVSDIILLFGFTINAVVLIKILWMKYTKKITMSWVFVLICNNINNWDNGNCWVENYWWINNFSNRTRCRNRVIWMT